MNRRPEISIKLVLLAENRVLMLHRKKGSWEFPGGRLEWGETPEAAIRREFLEELNYPVVGSPVFLSVYSYIAKDGSQHSVILHYFLSITTIPKLSTTAEEKDAEVVWLTKDELHQVVPNPSFINQIYSH